MTKGAEETSVEIVTKHGMHEEWSCRWQTHCTWKWLPNLWLWVVCITNTQHHKLFISPIAHIFLKLSDPPCSESLEYSHTLSLFLSIRLSIQQRNNPPFPELSESPWAENVGTIYKIGPSLYRPKSLLVILHFREKSLLFLLRLFLVEDLKILNSQKWKELLLIKFLRAHYI